MLTKAFTLKFARHL